MCVPVLCHHLAVAISRHCMRRLTSMAIDLCHYRPTIGAHIHGSTTALHGGVYLGMATMFEPHSALVAQSLRCRCNSFVLSVD